MKWKYPAIKVGKSVTPKKDNWGAKLLGKMNSWGESSVKVVKRK